MKKFVPYFRIRFEPRDVWIGVYIGKSGWEMGAYVNTIYLCIIPMFPILISWISRTYEDA